MKKMRVKRGNKEKATKERREREEIESKGSAGEERGAEESEMRAAATDRVPGRVASQGASSSRATWRDCEILTIVLPRKARRAGLTRSRHRERSLTRRRDTGQDGRSVGILFSELKRGSGRRRRAFSAAISTN